MAYVISRQPVKALGAHPSEYYEIVRNDDATYSVQLGMDVSLLTEDERRNYDEARLYDNPFEQDAQEEDVRCATVANALRYIDFLDAERSAEAELAAFGVPKECRKAVWDGFQERFAELFGEGGNAINN
jgi:hypothetical protein